MDISRKILEIRSAKMITQTAVADALEMDRGNYSKLEKKGDKLTIEQLKRIADVLEVSIGELLGIEDTSPKKDLGRVKELERRVGELEEVKNILLKSNQEIQGKLDMIVGDKIGDVRDEMFDVALNLGFLTENNTEGFLKVSIDGNNKEWEYDYDGLSEKGIDKTYDFIISRFLNEDELLQIFRNLQDDDEFMEFMFYFLRIGFLNDKNILNAFQSFFLEDNRLWRMKGRYARLISLFIRKPEANEN